MSVDEGITHREWNKEHAEKRKNKNSMDMSLGELRELVMHRAFCDSWGRQESDMTERLN